MKQRSSLTLGLMAALTLLLATGALLVPTDSAEAWGGTCRCVGPVSTLFFTGTGATCEAARLDAYSQFWTGCDGSCVFDVTELDSCPEAGNSFDIQIDHQCLICF